MDRFPSEFSELLSPVGQAILSGNGVVLPADLSCEGEHFFALVEVLDYQSSLACLRLFERDFGGRLGKIRARIPPESITGMTRNFSEVLPKAMDVDSVIFRDSDTEAQKIADQNGLLGMLRSASLLRFAEALTGLHLEGGWGSQVICYRHGHFVGPHNDHHPEFEWARNGYVDVQFTFANEAVDHQWFVHEKDGLLSQIWNINMFGGVTVFRQPFWHYTTPLVGKMGREAEARRWLVGQVFRILETRRSSFATASKPLVDSRDDSPPPQSQPSLAPARFCIEEDCNLSRSVLWKWQRRFYEEKGFAAWDGIVPSRLTTSPYLASAYARIVSVFVRDCLSGSQSSPAEGNGSPPGEPIYILECGAGSGCFAYRFLNRILPRIAPAVRPRIKYVMTEFSERPVRAWAADPRLRDHVDAGNLDFAVYDAEQEAPIRLIKSGEVLGAGLSRAPIIVLANYFFDSIPQDLFRIEAGVLHEGLVSVYSSVEELDKSDPAILDRCDVRFDYQPVEGTRYAGEPEWGKILDFYRARLDNTSLLFPSVGLRCLRFLGSLSQGPLLVLAADKGHCDEHALTGEGDPAIAVHGSFSLMVNFHALELYTRNRGGWALHTSSGRSPLEVSAFLLSAPPHVASTTQSACEDFLAPLTPLDRHSVAEAAVGIADQLSLEGALGVLRLVEGDPHVFCKLAAVLRDRVKDAGVDVRDEQALLRVLDLVWSNHFAVGDEPDVAFEIGTILQTMQRSGDAISYYEASVAQHGEHYTTCYNLGLCYDDLGRVDEAVRCFERAVSLNPQYGPAREWLELSAVHTAGDRSQEQGSPVTM